jgi:nucleoside-diphosphate-sugar epimerase
LVAIGGRADVVEFASSRPAAPPPPAGCHPEFIVRILITGGSGFIGSWFYDRLVEAGHDLVLLDLVEPEWDASSAERFVQGDIRDPDAVRAGIRGCDAVLHLAAAHHDFGIEERTYFDVNERGTRVICEVMDEVGVKRICFYSTVAVYGDAAEPHFEDAPKEPNSPYGASKLAGERVLQAWAERGDGRQALVIRPTVTYGPRNFANMYSLIRQVDSGKFFQVGPATNIKSLSYIENIVEATLFLWQRDEPPAFDVFNYIDKPDLTSAEISKAVYDALGRPGPKVKLPMWFALLAALPFDVVIKLTGKNLPVSSARIKKLFAIQTKFEADKVRDAGYVASVSVREGIERMVRWYEARGKHESATWHTPPAETRYIPQPGGTPAGEATPVAAPAQ